MRKIFRRLPCSRPAVLQPARALPSPLPEKAASPQLAGEGTGKEGGLQACGIMELFV